MSRTRFWLVAFIGLAGPAALAQDIKEEILTKPFEDRRDLTLLKRVTEKTFVHEVARVSFTVPDGWKEIHPHRLARRIDPRISTVLGIERGDRDLVASIYWIPMNPGSKLSEWARDTAISGEYGEEYETLKAVYGRDRVSIPTKQVHGVYEVYRINIRGGPDRGDRYEGSLFVFEAESGGRHWLVKARVSYPKAERGMTGDPATEVLSGFVQLPESPGVKRAATELDGLIPDKR